MQLDEAIREIDLYANTLGGDTHAYWQFHRYRLRWISELTASLVPEEQNEFRILDLGNSFQTLLLERLFPSAEIDTFGFFDHRYAPKGDSVHFDYDLNQAFDAETWPVPRQGYDLITFLEVIEHLYVSPKHVLNQLSRYLKPRGLLIVSTPNAARLSNRMSALRGKNPFEPIRENHHLDPGHIREYTSRELCRYARDAGYSVLQVYLKDLTGDVNFLYRYAQQLFPALRNDLVLVLGKE